MFNDRPSTSEFVKVGEAARILGVNRRTVYRRIWNGDLPARKVGGLYYIRRADLETMLSPAAPVEHHEETDRTPETEIPLKCGSCFRIIESDTQVAEVCAAEGCDAILCTACWEAGERYCARHRPDDEARWQDALRRYRAGEIPVLVRSRDARLQENNFLERIRTRITQVSTLLHPFTGEPLTVDDWEAHFRQGDERAQVMRLLNRLVLDAETTDRLPLDAWMEWTLPAGRRKGDLPLCIRVQVRSRIPEMLRAGFDTRPLGGEDLTDTLSRMTRQAEMENLPTIALLASLTGWDETARRMIVGDAPGTAFAHRLLLIYLFDFQSRELLYNPHDDRLRGYAELFTPLLPSEEVREAMRIIETEMARRDTLTISRALETLPFTEQSIRKAFEALAAGGEYTLLEVPDLGTALVTAA